MLQWNKRVVDICPRCGFRGEDSAHILECKSPGAKQVWMQGLEVLELKLIAEDTCPDIRYAMIEGIRSWKNNEAGQQVNTSIFMDVKSVITAQSKIGWKQFVE